MSKVRGAVQDALSNLVNDNPVIIMSDILMPTMNGIEVLRKAKFHRPNAVLIAITAFSGNKHVNEIKSIEVFKFLDKATMIDWEEVDWNKLFDSAYEQYKKNLAFEVNPSSQKNSSLATKVQKNEANTSLEDRVKALETAQEEANSKDKKKKALS